MLLVCRAFWQIQYSGNKALEVTRAAEFKKWICWGLFSFAVVCHGFTCKEQFTI